MKTTVFRMTERREEMPLPALGLIPLAIYAAHLRYNVSTQRGVNSLWICHIALLLQGFGLFLRKRWTLGVACIWQIIGLAGWIFDMITTGERSITSVLSHIGGLGISLFSVSRTGVDRADWARASAFFLGLQEFCRRSIPPDLNVNAAFEVRPEVKSLFPHYRAYWTAGTLAMLAITFGINRLLATLFGHPAKKPR